MKRKFALFGGMFLALVVLVILVVPVFAGDGSDGAQPATQSDQGWQKIRMLGRILLIQDEAKVDALIARAGDKLSAEQAARVKDVWTDHHQQFTKKVIVTRLLWAKDGAKVQAFLDEAVANGKINLVQSERIMTLWNKLHTQ
jgi:hypothetical protein